MSYDDRHRRDRSRSRERAPPRELVYNQYGGLPPLANNVSSAVPGMMMHAQQAAQEKIHRELFVGNTPPGTSELLLMQFVNSAMRRVGLCQPHETPILNSRVNQKFAFIECVSTEMANKALSVNGIPFLGAILKISRPSKYAGEIAHHQTWQELTGQSLPMNAVLDASAEEKIKRELFVGNTTPEMTESMLREFLGQAMLQVGLNIMPGNPITACRVSGKFAFIELRSPQEAANALNLNNIPFLGAQLRVGRPSKWTGPTEQHGNWEDIIAKYMSGELRLPQNDATGTSSATIHPMVSASTVVELRHMLTEDDLKDDQEYTEILEDTRDECSQFGTLKQVIIPRLGEKGATKIFLEYSSSEDAAKAIQGLAGRTFDGRKVEAVYYDEAKFSSKNFD